MSLRLDLTYSLRRILRHPGFLVTTVVSLGLGVGANATFFSAANTLLLQPMHVPRPGELVRVYRGSHSPFSLDEYRFFRERTATVGELVAETQVMGSLATEGEPRRVRISLVSGNAFRALGVVPAQGRLFARDDDATPAPVPEAVVSHMFWTNQLGADTGVVGRTIRVNAETFTIVGVAPATFPSTQHGWKGDVFVAFGDVPALLGMPVDSMGTSYYVTGRLASGRSVDDAQAEFSVIGQQFVASLPEQRLPRRDYIVNVRPARGVTEEVRPQATAASLFVLALAALILIIAATNIGNVLLARNAARRRELGVRLALGASRQNLLRMLVLEGAWIALLATGAAVLLAWWTTGLVPRLIPTDAEVYLNLTPDWRVLAYTGLVSLGALLIFAVLPALQATRWGIAEGIKEESGIGSRVTSRLRRRFLMVQVGLCTVLLATASLFLRSLDRARDVELGFNPEGVLIAPYIDVRNLRPEAASAFFSRLLDEAGRVPGVDRVTYSATPELTGSNSETGVFREGEVASDANAFGQPTYFNVVGPGYHALLEIPLVSGRDFARTDVAGAPRVAIVNETFAARMWPGEDPIGKRISIDGDAGPYLDVIGVSKNVRYHTLGEGEKMFLTVPSAQRAPTTLSLELRLRAGASGQDVGSAVASLVRSLEPSLAPPPVQPLVSMQRVVLLPAKIAVAMLGGIGALAVLLAAVGIAGVASYTVTQRRREIGIRLALGAAPMALLRAVLGDTWRTVLVGAGVGLVLALAVGRLVSSQLYGLPFADPITFVVVPLMLMLMGAIAAFGPARRAIRLPITQALRPD
jgi:predicted permease